MTTYRKYSPSEIEIMASGLNQELADGILSVDILEMFKFLGPAGDTWTILPQDGSWYRYQAGKWQPTEAPAISMDGMIEILSIAMLPFSPTENHTPEKYNTPPPQQDLDVRKSLEGATRRVRDSYNQGKINSAGAENLLKDLYLLDPAGVIWSYGMHSEEWYFFRQDDWELAVGDGPNPLDFQPGQATSPKFCSKCGTSLKGGKFCSECGSPAPKSEGSYSQAAEEVVVRFTESGVAALPEPVVPDWESAPGFPGTTAPAAQTAVYPKIAESPAAQISSQQSEWRLRVSQGVGMGQSFTLGAHARLGRTNTNEIVLAEPQSSRLHALIQQQDNSYVIADQNSTNGTFVNGVRIQSPTRLQLGDTISIGDTFLVVEGDAIALTTIAKPRPLQVQPPGKTANSVLPAPAPKKRSRIILLVAAIIFFMACLCLCTLGVGGYFYYEDQNQTSNYQVPVFPTETSVQSHEGAIGDTPVSPPSDTPALPTSPTPAVLAPEISDSPGHIMLLVPAGVFQMGGDADTALAECLKLHDPEGCNRTSFEHIVPVHSVTLGDFYIDKFEVTNAQYAVFLNQQGNQQEGGAAWMDAAHEETLLVERNGSWQPKDGFALHPVVRVSWYGARAYCEWRGARLPTEAEWEKAARGTDGRLYPWGNSFDGAHLNSCDANCTIIWAAADFDDGYDRTAPIGSYPDGVSPYGLYDTAGNVAEWVEDWFDVYPGGDPDSSEYYGREYRVARGGSWYSTGAIGTTYRIALEPDKPISPTGFRCASSP